MLSCLECLPDISPRRPWRQTKIGKNFFMEDSVQKMIADFTSGISHPEVFCKKGVLKKFIKFTRKHLCWSIFLIKLRPATLSERGFNTSVFL